MLKKTTMKQFMTIYIPGKNSNLIYSKFNVYQNRFPLRYSLTKRNKSMLKV